MNGNIICFLKKKYYNFDKSDLAKRLSHGAFWALLGSVSSKLILLISGILAANILGKNLYGEYSIIKSTVIMFVVFASLGLGLTASKYISQYRETAIQKAYNVCIVTNLFAVIAGLLVTVGIVYFSSDIATKTLEAPYLKNDIKWGGILLFFCCINAAQSGILSGFEDFRSIAINSFISSIFELLFTILGAIWFGVRGAIIGAGLAYAILFILNNISIRKKFPNLGLITNIKTLSISDFAIIWKFSIPAAFSNMMVIPILWYVKALLVRETSFGEIAVFNASDQIKTIILFIPISLGQIILPILSNLKSGNNSKKQYYKVLKYNFILNFAITFILSFLVIIFSSQILGFWGKDFVDTISLVYLSISTIFTSLSSVLGQAIASFSKMWIGFIFNAVWGGIVLLLSVFFIKNGYGSSGIALAILIAYIIHTIYQCAYFNFIYNKQ